MNYQNLTIYNFKISYFLIRIFLPFWLVFLTISYHSVLKSPDILFEPIILTFLHGTPPSVYSFSILAICTGILAIASLFRQSIALNVCLFLLVALLNLFVYSIYKINHINHLLILSLFFGVFLLPRNLKFSDYKKIQFFYLGLLLTYSVSGFWKLAAIFLDLIQKKPEISWMEPGAAKVNTMVNFYLIDRPVPDWMISLYSHETIWIIITMIGIFLQFLSFLGAFNRKYLTFTMIFLILMHLYNYYFVLADFRLTIIVVIILFFPYHLLQPVLKKMGLEPNLTTKK